MRAVDASVCACGYTPMMQRGSITFELIVQGQEDVGWLYVAVHAFKCYNLEMKENECTYIKNEGK